MLSDSRSDRANKSWSISKWEFYLQMLTGNIISFLSCPSHSVRILMMRSSSKKVLLESSVFREVWSKSVKSNQCYLIIVGEKVDFTADLKDKLYGLSWI